MKDSTHIKSESEIEVKEEVENGGIDSNERIDPKTKTYCLLCQEYGHVINDNCVVNATCFSCGAKGHVRRDCYCLICQEPGHVIHDGCATCLSCGVKGHVRRNCPSLLDTSSEIPDSRQKRPLSIQTQEPNPKLEIRDDQKMGIPPSPNTVNTLPNNDNIPALPMSDSNPSAKTSNFFSNKQTNSEYIEAKNKTEERDRERRLYNRPGLPSKIDAPCKYFFSKGCKFGLTCKFKHDNERRKTEEESRRNLGRSRSRSGERRTVHQNDPVDESISKGPGAGAYDAEQRQEIVRELLVDLIAPSDLARKYKISAHSIRDWVKKTGKTLPKQYKKSEWGPRPSEKTQSLHGFSNLSAL